MRKSVSFNTFIRVLSLAVIILPCALAFFVGNGGDDLRRTAACAIFAACAVIMCAPVNGQDRKTGMVLAVAASAGGLPAAVSPVAARIGIVLSSSVVLGQLLVMVSRRIRCPRCLFGENSAWRTVEEYVKYTYSAILLFLALIFLAFPECRFPEMLSGGLLAVLYPILYWMAYFGRTLPVGKEKEDKIKEMEKLSSKGGFITSDERELSRMQTVYTRCVNVMEEKKPYLDPNFSLEALSLMVYSNKSYISRSVNAFSGMNFKKFLNKRRIEYALDMIENDPDLKVAELSLMCGFNTPVSFTMAFKLVVGQLPSDYIREKQFARTISR